LEEACFNNKMTFAQSLEHAQKHLAKNDPKLALIIEAYGPCRLKPHTDYYAELVSGIVGQQLSVKAARTIWKRVLDLFGGKMPTPEELALMDTEKLRACGMSYPKVSYTKDLANRIINKQLDLAHISTMPNDQLIEQLTAVKGIGEWSAHMFMIFSLGRLDVLPIGDLGVRKALMKAYDLDELPKPETCVTIANENNWHPYESVAALYLWESLDNAPIETRHT
jgi:DNA-3-methyladenine glycosylase II